jgi:hypothetical protein
VNEIRKFDRVSDEEHRGVITNHIPIAFFSVELDSKTTRIALSISRSLLASNSRETSEDRCALANSIKELSFTEISHIVGGFKVAPCTSSLSMNYSFRDTFSVEVSDLVDVVKILEEDTTVFASSNRVLVIIDR